MIKSSLLHDDESIRCDLGNIDPKKHNKDRMAIKGNTKLTKRRRKDNTLKKYKQFSPNKSVVKVFVTKNSYNYINPWAAPTQSEFYGSGFIIEGKRVVTNAHMICNSSFVQVRMAGSSQKYEAKVRRVSHSVDLAILEIVDTKNEGKIEEFFDKTTPLVLGQTPRVGDTVRAYGFPWGGNEMSLTKGVVSRVEMDVVSHSRGIVLACDMDTAITGGNSGGPVMSIPGDDGSNSVYSEPVVVGAVFQGYESKQGGYIIACEVLKRVIALDDIGEILRVPELGIATQILENMSLRKSLGLNAFNSTVNCTKKKSMNEEPCVEKNDTNKDSSSKIESGEIESIGNLKAIEGGIMIYKVGDFSPAKDVLQKRDVLLQIDEFQIGENGTVEFRKGERTKWTYCFARKCVGESVTLKYFRGGVIYTDTIKLDKTRNDICHVGEKEYDVKPNYLIKSGFVFQPLNLNLYHAMRIGSTTRAKLIDFRTKTNPGYILMTKVLQSDITTGYEMTNEIVETVNGKTVHTMLDLVEAFKLDSRENSSSDESDATKSIDIDKIFCKNILQENLSSEFSPSTNGSLNEVNESIAKKDAIPQEKTLENEEATEYKASFVERRSIAWNYTKEV